jgi:hypothetical protein
MDMREFAIKAVILSELNDVETCTVGFIAREFHGFSDRYVNQLLQVDELLVDSVNRYDRSRAHHNRGIAICRVITE